MRYDPHAEWTYREIECRLYRHFSPDGFDWAGYVKIGDEWQEAGPMLGAEDEETARTRVEDHIDKVIMMAKSGDKDDGVEIEPYNPEPIDPDPLPGPIVPPPGDKPNPDPLPTPGPIWFGDNTEITTTSGTSEVDKVATMTGTVSVTTSEGDQREMSMKNVRDAVSDGLIEDGKIVV